MLKLQDGEIVLTGKARFKDADHPGSSQEGSSKIFVKVSLGELDAAFLAQLDTGAPWSIFDAELADLVELSAFNGQPIKVDTRLGTIHGELKRVNLKILADEGDSLDVQATVFVSPEWRGGNFLGYSGLLERIDFAIAPQRNTIYFGSGSSER